VSVTPKHIPRILQQRLFDCTSKRTPDWLHVPGLFRLALIVAIGVTCRCTSHAKADDRIEFGSEIRAILSDKCFGCHGPDAQTREAGLRLDTLAGATADLGGYAAIVPGHADQSELVHRIEDKDDPMPPPDSNRQLTEREKQILRRWIDQGAEYKQHWSFVPPQRPTVPAVDAAIKNPIDAFVAKHHQEQGLRFAPEASPETLIRRVTLDLTGLPPTVEEVDAFIDDYAVAPERAWNALIDRLIQSPRYGETMALPWLDAARFADTDGYQYDGPRFQWRWRDWVIDAYNRNLPFDQFTIEQLAGDLLPNATVDQQIATAFNRNHRYNSEAGIVVEEFLLENAVDRVDTTSTLWMGLTMGCARCHDHKYDPISQRDYYQLIAFFNSVPEAGRAIKSGNSEPVMIAPTTSQQREVEDLERQVAAAWDALQPGDPQSGAGPLIDRELLHDFPLETLPEKSNSSEGKPAIVDAALSLDGESVLNLTGIDKAAAFRANQPFTISFWIRPESLHDSVVLSRQNPGTTRPGIEVALVEDGKLQFDLITRWVAGTGRVRTTRILEPGQWTHVTLTNDGSQSANGQRIYFDGQPVATTVHHNTNSNVGGVRGNRPLMLGGGIRPGSNRFHGQLRALRIYRTDLWPKEIEILGSPAESETRRQFAAVKPTEAYERYVKLREQLDAYRETLPTVMVMKEASRPKPTFVRKRGVYHSLGQRVERDVPATLPPMDESLPRNRLGFAKWLVSPNHPLTARVAVNRYWQKYFGAGLVRTPEDFGTRGEPPTHPQLLDWLAVEFIESGWDIARMQKLIVSSRTYRQDSRVTEDLRESDPNNRWLARAPRFRLTGHAIRDQALFVAGLLNEDIGGPSVKPYQPPDLWAEMSMGMRYKQSRGSDLFRRSLYTIWKRTVAPPTMAVFDSADRETCVVGRKETNTPLQALTLLNETGFVESARHLAARMLEHEDPIEFGFRTVTARRPESKERDVLEAALAEYSKRYQQAPEAANDLIQTGESPTTDRFPAPKLAAYTALANVLLNLDEVITRE
jgi:hypothetical protein